MELSQQGLDKTNPGLTWVTLLIAVMALSMAGILIRLSETEISPMATAFNRLWISTILFGFLNGFQSIENRLVNHSISHPNTYTSGRVGLLLVAATIASVALLLWNWAVDQTSIANATVLRNTNVLFTPLLGWLVWNQRYDSKFLSGIGLTIIGVIAIGVNDFTIATSHVQGDLAAVFSSLLISAFFLIVEQLRTQLNTTTILLWRCGVGTVLILPIFLLAQEQRFPYSLVGWLAIIAQAIICQGLGQGLLVYSLKRLSSGFIALVVPLEVIFAAITAWVIFSEAVSWLNGLAFAVISLGIYLAQTSPSSVKPIQDNE